MKAPSFLPGVLLSAAVLAAIPCGAAPNVALPPSVAKAFKAVQQPAACFDIIYAHQRASGWYCDINPHAERAPSFVLFGDSHSATVQEVVKAAALRAGRRGITTGFSGCPPLLGIYAVNRPDQFKRDCNALNRRMLDYVKHSRIKDMILVAKWSYYTNYWDNSNFMNALGIAEGQAPTFAGSRIAFTLGVARTVQTYSKDLGVRLHILEQIPQQAMAPDQAYASAWQALAQVDARLQALSAKRARHREQQAFPASVFSQYQGAPNVNILNADDLFCDAEICLIGKADKPYYQDITHLSSHGAELLLPMMSKALAHR